MRGRERSLVCASDDGLEFSRGKARDKNDLFASVSEKHLLIQSVTYAVSQGRQAGRQAGRQKSIHGCVCEFDRECTLSALILSTNHSRLNPCPRDVPITFTVYLKGG